MGRQVDKTSWSTPTLLLSQIQLYRLIRNCCPSLSIKEVIELDSVIDVELVIGKLHQYWVVFLSGYLLLFFLQARISWTISHYVNVSLLSYSYRTQYTTIQQEEIFPFHSYKVLHKRKIVGERAISSVKAFFLVYFDMFQVVGKRPNGC